MRFRNCAAAIAAIGLAVSAADAADIGRGSYVAPSYAPATIQTYSWMGPYIGFNAGYQWGNVTNNPTNPSGFAGGLQAGYNFQNGRFVFGAETDIQGSTADDTFAAWKFSNPWFGTLRARIGIAFNNILLYGTGGLAYGDVRGQLAGVSETHTHLGWTAGLGIEIGLTPNWSAKAEYLYVDLGQEGYAITGTQNALESNLLRFGVNYRF